jgi:hypothetical protein
MNEGTQALRCDQYVLARFSPALLRATQYERIHFQGQEGRTIMRVRGLVQDIQRGLANLTSLAVNATSEMTRADVEACGNYAVESELQQEKEGGDMSEQEVRTGWEPNSA